MGEIKKIGVADYGVAFGNYNRQPEIYIGVRNKIYIYDGENLTLKDSIKIFNDGDNRTIASIESNSENLLFVGAFFSPDSGHDGSIAINRQTKNIVSQTQFGGNCLRLRAYSDNVSNQTNVIGIVYASNAALTLDRYDKEGKILNNYIEFSPQARTSLHLLKTTDESAYFITSDEGNIFLKSDLTFQKGLNGTFNDIVISKDGNTIYGLKDSRNLTIFDYPSLAVLETKKLEQTGIRAFLDEGQIIIVHFVSNSGKKDIYLSKIDI